MLTRGPFRRPRPSGGVHRMERRVICGPGPGPGPRGHPDSDPPSEQPESPGPDSEASFSRLT